MQFAACLALSSPTRGPMDDIVEGATITTIRPAPPINEFGTRGREPTVPSQERLDRVIDANQQGPLTKAAP